MGSNQLRVSILNMVLLDMMRNLTESRTEKVGLFKVVKQAHSKLTAVLFCTGLELQDKWRLL